MESGEMFVAVRAERDGHHFIRDAAKLGASSALVDHFVADSDLPQLKTSDVGEAFLRIAHMHRRNFEGKIIGVTGSCGKTSTKDVLQLLFGYDTCLATNGNFNNLLGVPLTLLRIECSVHLKAVVEAGINRIGEMDQLAKAIAPDLTLVTMVASAHLEGLGSEIKVAQEKARLIQDSGTVKTAIFPEHCLQFDEFREVQESEVECLVLKYGDPMEEPPKGFLFFDTKTETNMVGDAASLRLRRRGYPPLSLPLPIVSEGMASNCALAVAAALELGVSEDEIFERLPQYKPSALRGKWLQGRGNFYYVDCYNANPASMLDAIRFFQRQAQDLPKLLTLGGMEELGDEGPRLHQDTGSKINIGPSDKVLLVGEKAQWLKAGILRSGIEKESIQSVGDVLEAKSLVSEFEGAVLLKGSRANALETLVPNWATEEGKMDYAGC
jgi:UDP-N-acetylmuramoyl-tripeptide--D-alanyl-D-alanine ligase